MATVPSSATPNGVMGKKIDGRLTSGKEKLGFEIFCEDLGKQKYPVTVVTRTFSACTFKGSFFPHSKVGRPN
jgi:hypothetical protein